MKKIIGTIVWVAVTAFFITSCTPETPPQPMAGFHIVNIYADTASINSCAPSDGGANGSVFDFYLEMDSIVGYANMPKVRFNGVFESGALYGPFTHTFPQFFYDFTDNEIEHSACIRFGASNWMDMTYVVLNNEGHPCESATIRINRPAGAN